MRLKRHNFIFLRVGSIVMAMLFVLSLFGCSVDNVIKVYDYFGRYEFVLPYEVQEQSSNYSFVSELSLEQQLVLIEQAGYVASIFENYQGRGIEIQVEQDGGGVGYFFLQEKLDDDLDDTFVLTDGSLQSIGSIFVDSFVVVPILLPLNSLTGIVRDEITDSLIEADLESDWDNFVEFFERTKSPLVSVDQDSHQIKFSCEGWVVYGDADSQQNENMFDKKVVDIILEWSAKDNANSSAKVLLTLQE